MTSLINKGGNLFKHAICIALTVMMVVSVMTVSVFAATVSANITEQPEKRVEMRCTETKTISLTATGNNEYQWQLIINKNIIPISEFVAVLPEFSSVFKNYNTSALTVAGGNGIIHDPGDSIFLRCKVTPIVSSTDTASSANTRTVALSVKHNWVYQYADGNTHKMTCADCGSTYKGDHHYKWTVTETPSYSSGLAYKECAHCDHKVSDISVSRDSSTKVIMSFDSNGGINDLLSSGQTTYSDMQTKNRLKCPIDAKNMHRDGYTFLGWALCKDDAAPLYLPGEEIIYHENTTLYAVWGDELFGYSNLNDKEKKIYNMMDDAVRNMSGSNYSISAGDRISITDFEKTIFAYVADHPENFWFDGKSSCFYNGNNEVTSFVLKYFINGAEVSATDINAAKKELCTAFLPVMADLNAENIHDDDDIALWLHDKVAEIITYEFTANDQTVYGGLVEKRAVCAGYARLYQMFLNMAGIRAYTVTGSGINPTTGSGEPHAWTLMWLDGECFYSDVTWDDQGTELFHLYYARRYSEICVDHQASKGHVETIIPKCQSCGDHSYFTVHSPQNDFSGSLTVSGVDSVAEVNDDGAGTIVRKYVIYSKTQNLLNWLQANLNDLCMRYGIGTFTPGGGGLGRVGDLGSEFHLTITQTGAPSLGKKISGTVTSFNSDTDDITIEIWSGTTKISNTTVKGNTASYSFANVTAGSYTIKVSKADHVTREYSVTVGSSDLTQDLKIHLKGDVNGDGRVNTTDVGRANAHAKKTTFLEGYALLCADINGDGRVNTTDVGRMNAHAKKTNLLW